SSSFYFSSASDSFNHIILLHFTISKASLCQFSPEEPKNK
ncbi:unnamed protein product, partial [Brassica oleracea]